MAKKKAAAKAGRNAAKAARENPYIQRLVEDEDLRETLRSAYGSARNAFQRLNNGKAPTKALMDDKKLQKQLKEAASGFRDAAEALREGPKKKRRKAKRGGKGLLVLAVGAVAAIALSGGLRKKLLDTLFGAEEEFDYTSSTTPSQAAEKTTV